MIGIVSFDSRARGYKMGLLRQESIPHPRLFGQLTRVNPARSLGTVPQAESALASGSPAGSGAPLLQPDIPQSGRSSPVTAGFAQVVRPLPFPPPQPSRLLFLRTHVVVAQRDDELLRGRLQIATTPDLVRTGCKFDGRRRRV